MNYAQMVTASSGSFYQLETSSVIVLILLIGLWFLFGTHLLRIWMDLKSSTRSDRFYRHERQRDFRQYALYMFVLTVLIGVCIWGLGSIP